MKRTRSSPISVVASLGVLLLCTVATACARHAAPAAAPSAPTTAPPAPAEPHPAPAAVPPAPATPPAAPAPPPPAEPGSVVAELAEEGKALDPLVRTGWVHRFLASAAALPPIAPRTLYFDTDRKHYYSEQEIGNLAAPERASLSSRVLDEGFYYTGRYGTPLAYARPLDILGAQGFDPAGARIVDFGYGSIGQLRILAGLGADVTGVEIDAVTRALYSQPGDQGEIVGQDGARGACCTGAFLPIPSYGPRSAGATVSSSPRTRSSEATSIPNGPSLIARR